MPLEHQPVSAQQRTGRDPIALFQTWFQEAIDSGMKEPSAMSVATVDAHGWPDARMVLLKAVDERGFVFYTNMQSAKGTRCCATRGWRSVSIGTGLTSRCEFAAALRW